MKSLITIFMLAAAPAAHANHCLEQATNSELVRELDRRLNAGNPGGSYAMVDLTCNRGEMQFTMITENATEVAHKVDVQFPSNCEGYLQQIGSSLRITELRVVAVCRGAILHKIALTPANLKPLAPVNMTFPSNCEEKAQDINRG